MAYDWKTDDDRFRVKAPEGYRPVKDGEVLQRGDIYAAPDRRTGEGRWFYFVAEGSTYSKSVHWPHFRPE